MSTYSVIFGRAVAMVRFANREYDCGSVDVNFKEGILLAAATLIRL